MKRIIVFAIVFICCCAGCAWIQPQSAVISSGSADDLTSPEPKEYVITHDAYENWDESNPSDFLQVDLIPMEESAIAVANAILKSAIGEQEWKKLYLANVWEDVDKGVWIISFDPRNEDSDTIIIGGRVSIAISRHDAQVVKMWAEE